MTIITQIHKILFTMENQKHHFSEKECQWAILCHLSALLGFIIVPFGTILGPFVVWMLKKPHHPFVAQVGKDVLNFQISMLLWSILALGLFLYFSVIGIILLLALAATDVICLIIAAVQASSGKRYHYPLTIRIIR